MRNLDELNRLSEVKAPEALKERTLRLARAAQAEGQTASRPARRWGCRMLAAACALAVLIGGTALWQNRPVDAVLSDVVGGTFGIVAYAADTGKTMAPTDSRIVFDAGGGVDSATEGFFSGCLFRVTGEDIAAVSASINRGGLYRTKLVAITQEQAMADGEPLEGAFTGGMRPDGQGGWLADASWKLGSEFEEAYDPDAAYGLWSQSEGMDGTGDLQKAWHDKIDFFEGAVLNVTVTFQDGRRETQSLTLHVGKLGITYDGQPADAPKLTGEVLTEAQAKDTPYLYGIYADIDQQ